MLSNIYCKLNKFDAKTEAVSEINTKLIVENPNNLAEMQKKYGDFYALAATQHELKSKALKKIPHWIEAGCILDKRAYEQSTSEEIAIWKANFFKCKSLLSLTGGMGVDDWAWTKSGSKVSSVDINEQLNCLVEYNFSKLNIDCKRYTQTAESFLQNHDLKEFDLIYVDPDRREGNSRILGRVDMYSPNIFDMIEEFPNQTFLIKLSPMVDSDFLVKKIPRSMNFYSIVHQGEVKELLVLVHPLEVNVPQKKEMVSIHKDKYYYFSEFEPKIGNEVLFFEPNSGIFNLKLNREFKQLESTQAVNDQQTFFKTKIIFPKELGRLFRIKSSDDLKGSLSKIGRILNDKYQIKEASITARECKISTEEIRKTLKLKESDQHFLMITKCQNVFEAWLCEKFIYSN